MDLAAIEGLHRSVRVAQRVNLQRAEDSWGSAVGVGRGQGDGRKGGGVSERTSNFESYLTCQLRFTTVSSVARVCGEKERIKSSSLDYGRRHREHLDSPTAPYLIGIEMALPAPYYRLPFPIIPRDTPSGATRRLMIVTCERRGLIIGAFVSRHSYALRSDPRRSQYFVLFCKSCAALFHFPRHYIVVQSA